MKTRSYLLEFVMLFTYIAFGMSFTATGICLPQIMEDLNIQYAAGGSLSIIMNVAKIFGYAGAGILALKMGFRRAFLLASLLISVFGVATFTIRHYYTLLAFRFLMGLGASVIVAYFIPLVMAWFPERRRGVFNGINALAGTFGVLFGLIFNPLIFRALGHWQLVFLAYGVFGLVMSVLWLFLGTEAEAGERDDGNGWKNYIDAVKMPQIRYMIIGNTGVQIYFGAVATYFTVIYKSMPLFRQYPWLDKLPMVLVLMSLFSCMLGALWYGKTGKKLPIIRFSGWAFTLTAAVAAFFPNAWVMLAASAVCGLVSLLWVVPYINIIQTFPDVTPAKVSFLSSVFWSGTTVLSVIGIWLVGWLMDVTQGYNASLLFCVLASSGVFISEHYLKRVLPE